MPRKKPRGFGLFRTSQDEMIYNARRTSLSKEELDALQKEMDRIKELFPVEIRELRIEEAIRKHLGGLGSKLRRINQSGIATLSPELRQQRIKEIQEELGKLRELLRIFTQLEIGTERGERDSIRRLNEILAYGNIVIENLRG